MLLICLAAAGMRFWQLGDIPPGLYRDEAMNGLDALDVLDGQNALFFPRNNGREPAYIYLTAVSVALFGRTALAVRLAAAVVGTLTTFFVYRLGECWFGRLTGLLAAYLWAISVWPVHLSRIGLRVILLALPLTAAAWLATAAYRASAPALDGGDRPLSTRARWLWLAAGLCYGASFYTYLASRFTPVMIGVGLLLLIVQRRHRRLWPGLLWAAAGVALLLLPWLWLGISSPEIFLGRSGQVSIINPDINKGDFWGTLWQHCVRALGLFLFRGDEIIRHNPPGRPLFDLFMALPLVIGLVWLLRQRRRPAAWGVLLWTGIMLFPTILAEDAPHFLRAVGVLPAALFIPAAGLSQLASWPKLAPPWRGLLVAVLLGGSSFLAVRDYFYRYGPAADTGFLFESAARELSEGINREPADMVVAADRRYLEGWPSISFLVDPRREVTWLTAGEAPDLPPRPAALYLWPHDPAATAFLPEAITPPAVVSAAFGALARGDLEESVYPLYARYTVEPIAAPLAGPAAAVFTALDGGQTVDLWRVNARQISNQVIEIESIWSTALGSSPVEPLTVFVHVQKRNDGPLIGQDDAPPAQGLWPTSWWQPQIFITDTHRITLSEPFDAARHQIQIGLYPSGRPEARWLTASPERDTVETSWSVQMTPKP